MDGPPRRQLQRNDSAGRALSPTDSVTSIGSSHGPLLTWMFKHIQRENQGFLTKEDLRRLLGVDINNEQLDEAFENLDTDGDGRVSLEEFLAGFARFLREAPTTPGKDRHPLLRASGHSCLGEPVQLRPKKRGSVRRRIVDEEYYETTENGDGRVELNGGPAVKPSEDFSQSLGTLSSQNRHSISALWRNLAETNPELLVDFEDFVGEVAQEVEGAQRALDNQRKATKQEAMELDEEMESRLNAANANLQIQTALTEVKTKLKLEQRLGDKEKELSAVKQKLQELEGEVQAGQHAHTQLEEQYEVLSQEKADLQGRLEAREAVLMEKHEEMERLQQVSHSSRAEETQVELLEIKREYEREISELKETIMAYEASQTVTSDDDMSHISGLTSDLLSTMSTRHRHTSRHSLLDEIIKQEGIESPILRGEPLMSGTSEMMGRPLCRANSLPNLFHTRQYLDPIMASPIHCSTSPVPSHRDHAAAHHLQQHPHTSASEESADMQSTDQVTEAAGHVTKEMGHVTSDDVNVATLDPPLALMRSRSATVSGGGRPKFRPRRPPKKAPTGNVLDSEQSHVISHDGHLIGSNDSVPSGESQMTAATVADTPLTVTKKKERETGDNVQHPLLQNEQYTMKCQPLQFIENLATQPDYVFKILVVGNSYVGKSSFLMRLCANAFSARYSSTIGVDFYSKALKVDERIISLQLWDTAGQERFQSVTKAYYRGAQGVILMYDISQEESFIAVKSWINSIQENVDQMPAGLMLIGNKQDLDEVNEREVSTETGETFAKIYSAQFMETSAKTGFNVGNCLMNLVRTIKVYYEQDGSDRRERGIQIGNKSKGSSCCGR